MARTTAVTIGATKITAYTHSRRTRNNSSHAPTAVTIIHAIVIPLSRHVNLQHKTTSVGTESITTASGTINIHSGGMPCRSIEGIVRGGRSYGAVCHMRTPPGAEATSTLKNGVRTRAATVRTMSGTSAPPGANGVPRSMK